MGKKEKFTFEDHLQLAEELCRMRVIAMRYIGKLSRSYSKTSRQVNRVLKTQKAIDALRCEMDNVFYREYPGEQYRAPHYEWVHTPYYNPECEKRIRCQTPEQNDGDVKRCACAMGKKGESYCE